jgi:hypothetical protein
MPRAPLFPLMLGFLVAACDRDAEPSRALHTVRVTVSADGQPASGVLVTVTNVDSGNYYLELTDNDGGASFSVPDGSYLAHARNLEDTGGTSPAVPLPLSLAPLPDGESPLRTDQAEAENRVGVLYNGPDSPAAVLRPREYSSLTTDPEIVLTDPPSTTAITLDMPTGATIECTLLDQDDNEVTAAEAENAMLIFAHPAGAHLPRLPPELVGITLGRAILHGAATIPAGTSTCSLAGVPATNGFAVLQTNRVTDAQTGTEYVFAGDVRVPANIPGPPVPVRMLGEPPRVAIRYLVDAPDDAGSGPDLGLITYGWEEDEEHFTVAARFSPAGTVTLSVQSFTAGQRSDSLSATIHCDEGPCRTDQTQTEQVRSYGFASSTGATAVWRVSLPDADSVRFQVEAEDDVAPDTDSATSSRETPPGNTWLIPGD